MIGTNGETKSTEVGLGLDDLVGGDKQSVELKVIVRDDVEDLIGLTVEIKLAAIEANKVRISLN
jgi:hypothetical protein